MVKFDWDLGSYEDERNFEPVPAGVYLIKATNIEEKENAARTGEYLNVEFTILDPEYKNRKIWHIFNIVHKNADAERIGRSQLNAWARACGKANAKNSDQLLEQKCEARVVIEKNAEYGDRNRIKGFIISDEKPKRRDDDDDAPKQKRKPAKEEDDDEVPFEKPKASKVTKTKEEDEPAPAKKPASRKQAAPWEDD